MPSSSNNKAADKMLSFAPTPIFSGSWDHRPVVPSPLSSSPIRASSPLSPVDKNTLPQRQIQSSPIQPTKFKYASRPTRPNPVVRKREEAQEGRRKLFLQNVRQKSEDKAWQRRDIEGQFLKNSFLSDRSQLAYDAPEFSEADLEDAASFQHERIQIPEDDEMVMDPITEEDELEAMFASYEEQQTKPSQRPPSMISEDDWDNIFSDIMLEEQTSQGFQPNMSHQMDLSGEDHEMQI